MGVGVCWLAWGGLGSLLCAVFHVGYVMMLDEMVFLIFIGNMFAVVFQLNKSILVLWPVFQPMER